MAQRVNIGEQRVVVMSEAEANARTKTKLKIILWAVPIVMLLMGLFLPSSPQDKSKVYVLVIGAIWLGLLIYFTIKKHNEKK